MSHTTRLKSVVIRDVSALRTAVAKLKAKGLDCDLLENEKPRMYYPNQHSACDFVLRLHKGQYDAGFDRQADGSYLPVFDEWNGHVGRQLGAACPMPTTAEGKAQHQIGQFFQAYAEAAAINAAVAQGYMIESVSSDNEGNVHLSIVGM